MDGLRLAGEVIKGRQKITAAKAQKTADLIQSQTDNDAAWERTQINHKDRWLRRGSFIVFSLPMVWAAFDAEAVRQYFEVALAVVPEWYQAAYMSMIGAIWGVATLKSLLNK